MQVFKRFPLLHSLQYLAAPIAKLKFLSAMEAAVRIGVVQRRERRGNTEHVDLFDYIILDDRSVPSDRRELVQIGVLAQEMMFANYGAMCDWYYGTLLFLLEEPDASKSCQKRSGTILRTTKTLHQALCPLYQFYTPVLENRNPCL